MLGTVAEIKRNVWGCGGCGGESEAGGRPEGAERPLCSNRGFEIVFLMKTEQCEIVCPPGRFAECSRVP
jgi:hypothetical protein